MRISDKQSPQLGKIERASESLLKDVLGLGISLVKALFSGGAPTSTAKVPTSVKSDLRSELFAILGGGGTAKATAPAGPPTSPNAGIGTGAYDGDRDRANKFLAGVPSKETVEKWEAGDVYRLAESLQISARNVEEGLLSQKLYAMPPGTVLHGDQKHMRTMVPPSTTVIEGISNQFNGREVDDIARALAREAQKAGVPQAMIANGKLLVMKPTPKGGDIAPAMNEALAEWDKPRGDALSRSLTRASNDVMAIYHPKKQAANEAAHAEWVKSTQRDLDAMPPDVVLFVTKAEVHELKLPVPTTGPPISLTLGRDNEHVATALAEESQKVGKPCAYMMNSKLMVVDAKGKSGAELAAIAHAAAEDWLRRL